MRYLRRYNEEFEPSTYRKAANELIKKGRYHRERGENMVEYASLVDWRRLRDRCKRAGILTLRLDTTVIPANQKKVPDYVGEFHPVVDLGLDMFSDVIGSEIAEGNTDFAVTLHWFISAVPTTEEGYEQAHAAAKQRYEWQSYRKYDKDRGFPVAFFHFDIIFSGGSYEFGTPQFYSSDDIQVDAHLADRSGSGKIRSEILWQLDERCDESYSIHIGGEKHNFSNPREAFNGLLQYYGLSSDYGLESKAVYEYVKKIPGSFFTC
jgi:hypothetical protein